MNFLANHHDVFSLEEGERGETVRNVQLEIDTGDSPPKRQPLRRMPFAARQEVARQLDRVDYLGHVITPTGLKPNKKLVIVVQEFPVLIDVRELRRFLGLPFYYISLFLSLPGLLSLFTTSPERKLNLCGVRPASPLSILSSTSLLWHQFSHTHHSTETL